MLHTVIRMFSVIALVGLVASCFPGSEGDYHGRVVVYSPHGPDVLRDYQELFEAAYPGVQVQALDMGSQEVYSRISSEQRRPQADVWWGAPTTMFMQAAEEDLLEPYRPTWADAVGEAYRDPEDRWYGVYRSPLGILYNNRHYTGDQVPQTWDELLDPEWHGRIALRRPLPSGTMRTFIGAMILRAETVEHGFDWLARFHAATADYLENPQMLFDHLKRREDRISVWLMPDAALQRERNGFPFDCHVPPETPVLIEGIALIKDGPNPDWGRKFYEFVTTSEAFAHQAEEYWKIPVREDIEPALLPDWIASQEVDALAIDWETFAEQEQAWCDRWAREVYRAR